MVGTSEPLNRRTLSALAVCVAVPLAAAWLASPAQAGPLKQIMKRMNETTKAAKAELAAFDSSGAAALLQDYAQEARDAAALRAADASSKSQDLHARFVRLASTAENATAAANEPQFRKLFTDVVTQCKSCHSVYK